MAKVKRLIEVEGARSHAEAAAFLHQLADWIGEGKLILGEGEDAQVLVLPEELVLEFQVEAKKKKGKGDRYTLEIEIKWFQGKAGKQIEPENGEAEHEEAESKASV